MNLRQLIDKLMSSDMDTYTEAIKAANSIQNKMWYDALDYIKNYVTEHGLVTRTLYYEEYVIGNWVYKKERRALSQKHKHTLYCKVRMEQTPDMLELTLAAYTNVNYRLTRDVMTKLRLRDLFRKRYNDDERRDTQPA